MKKFLSRLTTILLVATLVLGCMTGCNSSEKDTSKGDTANTSNSSNTKNVKIGLICLHDENSTYDLNFINSIETVKKNLGLSDDQVIIKKNIPESNECREAAYDLADRGCNIILADSFGHEPYILEARTDFRHAGIKSQEL